MSQFSSTLLGFAAFINALPVVGVVSRARLETLYGVPLDDPTLVLLLRHRALLFAIVAVLLAGSIRRREWRPIASVAGLFSMLGFVALTLGTEASPAIQRVVVADVAASIAVGIAAVIDARTRVAADTRV